MSLAYKTLEAGFLATIPPDEPIKGVQDLLRSAFMMGATVALRLLEEGETDLAGLRRELSEGVGFACTVGGSTTVSTLGQYKVNSGDKP